jgi:hypothetical protein
MLSVVYAECHLCWVSLMLSVTHKSLMRSVVMLNVIMLNVIMLSVVTLNVIMLSVVILNVVGSVSPWVSLNRVSGRARGTLPAWLWHRTPLRSGSTWGQCYKTFYGRKFQVLHSRVGSWPLAAKTFYLNNTSTIVTSNLRTQNVYRIFYIHNLLMFVIS